jgi:phosphocarrier protein HPr
MHKVANNNTNYQNINNMIKESIEIINKLGLHARASTKFTQTASRFKSEIWVEKNGRRVNAKSIMGVMMLAAAKGSTIDIEANGEDEVEAIASLKALINNYFGEGE